MNNMVFYGDFVPNSHVVVVVDEEYQDPGEIPVHFLSVEDNDEHPDWFPPRATTAGPEIQISVQNVNERNVVPVSSIRNLPSIVSDVSRNNPESVLDMQSFSDIDGANK